MKKTYKDPEMNISVFDVENIVTGSSDQLTAADYAKTNANKIFGDETVNQARKIIVF